MTDMQRIVALMQAGQYSVAAEACRAALAGGQTHPQLQLMLAIASAELGQLPEALKLYDALQQQHPGNAEILYNRGLSLQNNQQDTAALEAYRRCTALQPGHASAWNNMGELLLRLDCSEEAIDAHRRAHQMQPDNPVYLRNLAHTLMPQDRLAEAAQCLERLCAGAHAQLQDFTLLIECLTALRQLLRASQVGEQALARFQGDAALFNRIGSNELERRRHLRAETWFEKAHALQPDAPECWQNLATVYSFSGRHDAADALFARLLETDQRTHWVFVAMMQWSNNRSDAAAHTVNEALKRWPEDPELTVLKAKTLRKSGHEKDALQLLQSVQEMSAPRTLQAEAAYETGKIHDHAGRCEAAWSAWTHANTLSLLQWQRMNPAPDPFIDTCRRMAEDFQTCDFSTQRAAAPAAGGDLIFVLGFPRSGTTLIDTLLNTSPDVQVLEEAPLLGEVLQRAGIRNDRYATDLLALDRASLDDLRAHYYQSLPHYLTRADGQRVIDKSPMNTLHAGLIHVLFPAARVVFCARHPMDVVLSCFAQNFKMNAFMTHFTDIRRSAEAYAAMLGLWRAVNEALPLNCRVQRYEELIEDPRRQTRALFDFVGLPWDESVLEFHRPDASRGTINNPSFDQVNRPLYTSSLARHRRYSEPLADTREVLAPWLEYLGYSD